MSHYHFHFTDFSETNRVLRQIRNALIEGFTLMSEASQRLTDAVTDVASKVDTLSTSLQSEIADITVALSNAGDADLRTAADDAVSRLGGVSTRLGDINSAIQGIVP